jgi:chromosome segregation ATPase
MADQAETTPVVEAAAEAKPLDQVNSLADYRARRGEVDTPPAEVPEAADPQPEPETEDEPADDKAKASEAGKALAAKKKSLQSRIDDVTAEKHRTAGERDAARAELAELREELAALKAGKTKPEAKPEAVEADPDDPEPKVEEFDDYQKYVKAQARWEARQEFKAQQAEADKRARGNAIQQAMTRVMDAGAKAHDDFDATVTKFEDAGGDYGIAVDAITRHPLGHELAYRMASDPRVAKAIAGAPNEASAIYELGRVMARIEAEHEAADEPADEKPAEEKPRKLSKAPAPIERKTGGGDVPAAPDVDRMNRLSDYRKARTKLVAA